jgi:tetratricopeptide (TPR) repeat protein
VDAAGFTTRELEKRTLTVRTGSAAATFYSKSQWGRWLNGQGTPPRLAVQRLAGVLEAEEGIDARRLLVLYTRIAAVPAQRVGGSHDQGEHDELRASTRRPRQVPSVTPDFAGRAAELAELGRLADQAGSGAGTGVVVITGTAGVGKTTLANYFGQLVADLFPGGQLYVNLRGFDPGGQPLAASAAMRRLLEDLGAEQEPVRDDLDALAARYRTLVAGRGLLIVIDNARDEQQARPLIPGSPDCLVIVTSRNELTGLQAQGARILTLAPFSTGDAQEYLVRRLGAVRVAGEPGAAAELIERCAGLPLAMSVAAAHAAARPGLPLAALAGELRRRGLDRLETGDRETSARAVFSWSYDDLSDAAKGMFRLLGTGPGPDISVPAAASLAALPAEQAHAALRELVSAHLAEEHAPGRFALHDLLRAYAAELAERDDGADNARAAERRLLDYYLHTGYAAALLLVPATDFGDLGPPAAGAVIDPPHTADEAMAWYTAESLTLLAACARAAERGLAARSWQLAWAVAPYLFAQGRWADSAAMLQAPLTLVGRTGDLRGQGHVYYHLAHALDVTGDSDAAEAHLRQSLDAFTASGDRAGQGLALYGLARVLQGRDRHAEALPVAREALRLRAAHGSPAAVATTQALLGSVCARLGLYAEAVEHCQRSLRICEEFGFGLYRADALHYLGLAYSGAGDHAAAAGCFGQAAEAYRAIGLVSDVAEALSMLTVTQAAAGNAVAARQSRAAAEDIIGGMPPADAARLRKFIERESSPPPPASPQPPDPSPPADRLASTERLVAPPPAAPCEPGGARGTCPACVR